MDWWVWLIILGAIVLIAVLLVGMYNKLVSLRNRAENAWAQVDVQLRKRYDLIPNLVEIGEGLRRARAAGVRRGDGGAYESAAGAGRAGAGAGRERADGGDRPPVRRRGGVSRSSGRPRTSSSSRRSSPRSRATSPSRARSTTTRCSRTRTRWRQCRRASSPASSTSGRASTSRSRRPRSARLLRSASPRNMGKARAAATLVAIWALALLVPAAGAAQEKSYSLPQAVVDVEIASDGSLLVREDITFSFSGLVLRRLPRHPGPAGRARRPRLGQRRRPPLPARRQHRPGELRPARQVRRRREHAARTRCLALPGVQRAARLHDPLPLPRARRRLRRRRGRQSPGLGRRVARRGQRSARGDGAAATDRAPGHPLPGLGCPRVGERRRRTHADRHARCGP